MRIFLKLFTLCVALLAGKVVCVALLAGKVVFAQTEMPGVGQILVNGRVYYDINIAFDRAVSRGIIRIGPGTFKTGGILKGKDGVKIIGTKDTVFDGAEYGGKATFVIQSNDTVIENITCKNVSVRDKNGACVRLEGTNLTLKNVNFSDSENGILAWKKSGKVLIEDSVFERNGRAGRAHGMYINGGELIVRLTKVLSSKDQGHGIKSRAAYTLIEDCLIASLEGDDSRLIDISDGGFVIIRNNLLIEGPKTVNWQLLAYGVEKKATFDLNKLRVENNVIITDREGGSEFLLIGKEMPTPIVKRNVVVGRITYDWPSDNFLYKSREEIGLPAAPALPEWSPSPSR